ncbi:hypothetical protein BDW62DRAFT_214424 [Aspergillus aurantiobrunneus]
MKLISVTLAALAATAAQGAALQSWCQFPGQVCGKTKRAVDAVEEVKRSADAMAEAKFTLNRWCNFPGQVCGKAKRAVDAIDEVKRSADAVAEAMLFLNELTPEDFQQIE